MFKILIIAVAGFFAVSCNNDTTSTNSAKDTSTMKPADSTSTTDTVIHTDSLNNYDGKRM